jgi:multisubunit Na+/H+ antiporter MnhB subunit
MTMLLHIKTFAFNLIKVIMYNNPVKKQRPRKRSSAIFLILGMAFLTIGLATDQTAFTWVAIAFVVISLIAGGKWLRPRK